MAEPAMRKNLIVTRRLGEQLVLQHPLLPADVLITFTELRRNLVRISIRADESVIIHRGELLLQVDAASTSLTPSP